MDSDHQRWWDHASARQRQLHLLEHNPNVRVFGVGSEAVQNEMHRQEHAAANAIPAEMPQALRDCPEYDGGNDAPAFTCRNCGYSGWVHAAKRPEPVSPFMGGDREVGR